MMNSIWIITKKSPAIWLGGGLSEVNSGKQKLQRFNLRSHGAFRALTGLILNLLTFLQ